jgi:hypothetical protein
MGIVSATGFVSTTEGEEIIKDTLETLDYSIDWSPRLAGFSGVIATSVWTVPAGITQATPSPSFLGDITTIFLSGGGSNIGDTHIIRNTITTEAPNPRVLIQSFLVKMVVR